MSTEENKAIMRRFFAIADRKAFDEADAVLANGFLAHMPGAPPLNAQGFIQFVTAFSVGFPDYVHTIEEVLVDGDRAVTRVSWQGTHTGTFQGVPPTGKHATMGGINIARVADGKIAEMWSQFDVLGLMQQLGAIPAPG